MTHDPLCPSLGHGALPVIDLCRCGLIARVRDDERGESGDWCKGWDAGFHTGYAAARMKAAEAIAAIPKEDGGFCHLLHACDVEAAIEALQP